MPILPIEAMVAGLDDGNSRIVRAAFTTRSIPAEYPGCARLRANKPFRRVETFEQGCANYVWRMLCFDLVGWGKHACMPICADFELADAQSVADGGHISYGQPGYEDQRQRRKDLMVRLDALVSEVESKLPPEAKKGIIRWGRALGMI